LSAPIRAPSWPTCKPNFRRSERCRGSRIYRRDTVFAGRRRADRAETPFLNSAAELIRSRSALPLGTDGLSIRACHGGQAQDRRADGLPGVRATAATVAAEYAGFIARYSVHHGTADVYEQVPRRHATGFCTGEHLMDARLPRLPPGESRIHLGTTTRFTRARNALLCVVWLRPDGWRRTG
jgi:hypothetical protein